MMQQTVLYKLIDAISDLMCHHGLKDAVKGSAVQALARAHLFVALRQLDGLHKGLALQFLYEANLIGAHVVADSAPLAPVLGLNGADLRGMVLPRSNLAWAHLAISDLSRADLRDACLIRANLYAADLVDADLANANLCGANLFMTDITRANFDGADLRSALVSPAQLAAAKVTNATRLPDSM
ncbi:MAG: pentapeptide repeat-containing protein [Caldilineaceae bacterium]|nr:pentapeptide repeat-containing protein [Caldilineaceae bacterium]